MAVAVAEGVEVAVAVPPPPPLSPASAAAATGVPEEVGEGAGKEGDTLPVAEASLSRLPVVVAVGVEERDSVRVPRGDLEVPELALALYSHPLPVAVVVEEVEGEEDTEGEAMVGM